MKELRRKSKIILFSALIICSIFGSIGIKAQPEMDINFTNSISPGESITITINFTYENIWQFVSSDIYIYYGVNSYDNEKIIPFDEDSEDRLTEATIIIPTYSLDLEDGDIIRFQVICDWGNPLNIYKGTLEDEFTVSVYRSSTNGGYFGIGALIGVIVGPIVLVILIVTVILSRRRKRKKFVSMF